MKRMYSLPIIFSFVMVFVVIAAENVHAGTSSRYTGPVNGLLKATIDKLGNSRSSVAARIGKPLSMSSEFVAKPDLPLQDDRIHTLTYDGMIIQIYHAAANNKERLLSVRMTKNRKELLPELIGKSEGFVISAMGQPTTFREGKIEYDTQDDEESGFGIIKLEFKNSSVDAVELNYYID